jgi:uncharacterized caspase-like protein
MINMVRLLFALALVVFAVCAGSSQSSADTRVALVIGNGTYANAPRLPNPTNDAADVAAALRRTSFETILATDLTKSGMDEALIKFARAARNADVAMFYYSGHAMQFANTNYLVPVDAKLADEADLLRMTKVDDIVSYLGQAKSLRILILDSCRDNPLADELKRSIGTTRAMSVQRGLARIESPQQGMIVAYSTQAGRTADDGSGKNSPYTSAFLKHIDEKDEIGAVFRRVSTDVYETTGHRQIPELSLSLIGEFYLQGKAAPRQEDTAARDFEAARSIDSVFAWDAFLKQHPDGFYATLAQEQKSRAAAKSAALPVSTSTSPPPAAPPPAPKSEPGNAAPSAGSGFFSYFTGGAKTAALTPETSTALQPTPLPSPPTAPQQTPASTRIFNMLRPDLKTDCDRLADKEFGPDDADLMPALSACTDAMRQYPEVRRFLTQGGMAAILIGYSYDDGSRGFKRNKPEALKWVGQSIQWFTKAADAGDVKATLELARIYDNGAPGVKPNKALAKKLQLQAAPVP